MSTMIEKINVFSIVVRHMDTFREGEVHQNRLYTLDLLLFYGLPAAVCVIYYFLNFSVQNNLVNVGLTVYSIFFGLLLNLLVLIHAVSNGLKYKSSEKSHKNKVMKLLLSMSNNIGYSVFISAIVLLLLVAFHLFDEGLVRNTLTYMIIYLSVNFGLTLLLVLKRAHIILTEDITRKFTD